MYIQDFASYIHVPKVRIPQPQPPRQDRNNSPPKAMGPAKTVICPDMRASDEQVWESRAYIWMDTPARYCTIHKGQGEVFILVRGRANGDDRRAYIRYCTAAD